MIASRPTHDSQDGIGSRIDANEYPATRMTQLAALCGARLGMMDCCSKHARQPVAMARA